MIFVRLIDDDGVFMEEKYVKDLYLRDEDGEIALSDKGDPIINDRLIEEPCPYGLFQSKWNGGKWVEGLTKSQIKRIISGAIEKPSLIEVLEAQLKTQAEILDFQEELIIELAMKVY